MPIAEIDKCIADFKTGIVAKLENYTSNVMINGQRGPSSYQIRLTSPLPACKNFKEATFKGNWTEVKNQKDENILSHDPEKMDKENRQPLDILEFRYGILINYHEGDNRPVKVTGNIVVNIPSKFTIVELSGSDINREFTIGTTAMKLLEVKGSTFKIQMSGDDPAIKILPLSSNNSEFSMNMGRNFPLALYNAFGEEKKLKDEDFANIAKSLDKNDKRFVKVVSVSGAVSKILVYSAAEMVTRKVEIELVDIR